MVSAHVLAVLVGAAPARLMGAGYRAASVALIVTIVLLVVLNIVHPPAISTADLHREHNLCLQWLPLAQGGDRGTRLERVAVVRAGRRYAWTLTS